MFSQPKRMGGSCTTNPNPREGREPHEKTHNGSNLEKESIAPHRKAGVKIKISFAIEGDSRKPMKKGSAWRANSLAFEKNTPPLFSEGGGRH